MGGEPAEFLSERPWEGAAEQSHDVKHDGSLSDALKGRVASLAEGLGLGEGTLGKEAAEKARALLAARTKN